MSTVSYIRNEAGDFVCPECGVTKRRQNTMFYHIKTHSGERKHVCVVAGCGRAFLQKSGLDQHMMQAHPPADSAPGNTCPCCPHLCRVRANMVIHIGRKHGAGWIPPYTGSCSGCAKPFASATAYFYHGVTCFVAPPAIATWLSGSKSTHEKPKQEGHGGGEEQQCGEGKAVPTHDEHSGCQMQHEVCGETHTEYKERNVCSDDENHCDAAENECALKEVLNLTHSPNECV